MTGHITKLGAAISDRVGSANICYNAGTVTTSFNILGSFTICRMCSRSNDFSSVDQEMPIFQFLGRFTPYCYYCTEGDIGEN